MQAMMSANSRGDGGADRQVPWTQGTDEDAQVGEGPSIGLLIRDARL